MLTPHVLAFDTATEQLAVALQTPAGRWCVNAPGGAAASATLLPHVLGLLAEAEIAPPALDFIAFGCGPGAFTGLRTACAVAQGLALGLGRPVLPVGSLLIVADDARAQAAAAGMAVDVLDVGVAMDARMNEVYAAAYRWQAGLWRPLHPPALLPPNGLAAAWQGLSLQLLAGSAWAVHADRLPRPPVPRFDREHDRAAALLRLALAAALAGEAVDAALALPLYLRDKVAQTTLERDSARGDRVAATAGEAP